MRCPLLTFTQETKGKGTPVAMQVKFKLSVSLTVLSGIDEIFGGTAIKQRKRKSKKKYLKLPKTYDKIRKSQMVARVGKAAED